MTTRETVTNLVLFPETAGINNRGHLELGGCDSIALAEEFGTPLYVFDEFEIRSRCAQFRTEFGSRYAAVTIAYSAKAFTNRALLALIGEEGLGLDVVSGGELEIARSVDFPMEKVLFPGNNKSAEELELALDYGVGRIVVDNLHELDMLCRIINDRKANILLRLTPGVDPHTHRYNTTGILDSKFGLTRTTWEQALNTAMAAPSIDVMGLHFHLGSGIFETGPYCKAIEIVLDFAADMKRKAGFELRELDIGGGIGVRYTLEAEPPSLADFAEAITGEITGRCRKLNLPLPALTVEPGRSIVGHAGVALYRAGVVKEIPDTRCYVSVDGGMGDNIRFPLYGARHEAVVANRVLEKEDKMVTISGKFCEPGDVLIRDISLPPVTPGDIIAVAGCGAYCIPLSSNYNASLRPAIVMVRDGKARLIRRRETPEDLIRCDVL